MRDDHREHEAGRQAGERRDPLRASARARREAAAAKRRTILALRDARKRRELESQPPGDPRLLEAQLRAARARRDPGA